MGRRPFIRQRRGVYATKDNRFYLEFWSSMGAWKLRERGELLGYKPSVLRTARSDSPVWLRSNSARAAIAWANHVIGDHSQRARTTKEQP